MTSTDPTALAAGPYRTPAPLSVRVAIYAWQRPPVDLPGAATTAGFRDIHEQIYDCVLDIPTTQPVLDYLDSCRTHFPALPDQAWTDIRANVTAAVAAQIQRHGTFHRTGRVGLVTAR